MPYLATNLRKLRQLHGYSQEYIAFNVGVTQVAYCKWETGQTRPSLDRLEQLARVYKLKPGDLLSEEPSTLVRRVIHQEHFVETLLSV